MILSAACWGFATVMSKAALVVFSPPSLVAIQLLASVTFLWVAVMVTGQGVSPSRPIILASLTGLLEPGLAYVFGTFGLLLTTAGNASLISTTEPLLILVLSWLLFRHRIEGRTLSAILVAVAGVLLVSGAHRVEGTEDVESAIAGDLLIVLATLFAALYVLVSSRMVALVPTVMLAALQQTAGLVLALIVVAVAVSPGELWLEIRRAEAPILGLALVSGIVQYALAFWFYLIGLRRLTPGTAGLFLTLVPVFGLLGATLFLGESVTWLQAGGAVLILSALFRIRMQ